jgi:hypothetical protein
VDFAFDPQHSIAPAVLDIQRPADKLDGVECGRMVFASEKECDGLQSGSSRLPDERHGNLPGPDDVGLPRESEKVFFSRSCIPWRPSGRLPRLSGIFWRWIYGLLMSR